MVLVSRNGMSGFYVGEMVYLEGSSLDPVSITYGDLGKIFCSLRRVR